jgi:hypothetical protein
VGNAQKDATADHTLNKTNLFLITSGLNNDYGIYSCEQKLDQLIASIESVRCFHTAPVDVIVIDSSPSSLSAQQRDKIKLHANWVIDCSDKMKGIIDKHPGQLRMKTFGEQAIWQTFFETINPDQHTYGRVFKLSGRYRLNEKFNLSNHQVDCVVALPTQTWRFSVRQPDKLITALPTRLWSFPWLGMADMHNVWLTIIQKNKNNVEHNNAIHMIECMLFETLQFFGIPIQHVASIGVEGSYGQDGVYVKE